MVSPGKVKVARTFLSRVLFGMGRRLQPKSQDQTKWVHLPFDNETLVIWEATQPYTMTTIERIDALIKAVEYVVNNSIDGDIVECGVWRGGSMMAVAMTLLRLKANRNVWLYDTFEGMTSPGKFDQDFQGRYAGDLMNQGDPESEWIQAKSPLDDVKKAISSTGFPLAEAKFVVGPVETTIPSTMPSKIALLRLDTDWFESTRHELRHLWPLLSDKGILIVDDYGDWAGAKKAVDEYFAEQGLCPYLHRIDATGRLIIKLNS
jgi:O-methyltransferase